jgi:integrase
LEDPVLRRQLGVLKRRHRRPRFIVSGKLFWVILRWLWPGWKRLLVLVRLKAVVCWQGLSCAVYFSSGAYILLARLGLRAGDIVQLRMDDIDWKEAGIRVAGKNSPDFTGFRNICSIGLIDGPAACSLISITHYLGDL